MKRATGDKTICAFANLNSKPTDIAKPSTSNKKAQRSIYSLIDPSDCINFLRKIHGFNQAVCKIFANISSILTGHNFWSISLYLGIRRQQWHRLYPLFSWLRLECFQHRLHTHTQAHTHRQTSAIVGKWWSDETKEMWGEKLIVVFHRI